MQDSEPEARYGVCADLGLGRVLGLTRLGLMLQEGTDRIQLDAEGRLHRAWLRGLSYQRGLAGSIRVVEPRRSRGRQRPRVRMLDPLDSGEILREVTRRLQASTRHAAPLPDALRLPLVQASRWTAELYAAEQSRFQGVYAPITILPPDQNRALVIQATLGCAWGKCKFCRLYAQQPYQVRTPSELALHIEAVLALHGRALASRRGVFLGQASALSVPFAQLCQLLRVVRERLVDEARWPVAAFGDFLAPAASAAELAELRRHGLVSVTLGLESGSREVLRQLGKPIDPEHAIAVALRLRDAGISRGLTVLAGAGGRNASRQHVDETAHLLGRMELTGSDRVYLSPLHAGGRPSKAAIAQIGELRAVLRGSGIGARVALYDIARFIY